MRNVKGLSVGVALLSLAGCGEVQDPYPLALAEDAHRALAEALKDPDSAKFQGVTWSTTVEGPAVCGLVNARNGFGAYGGAQRFIRTFSTADAAIIERLSHESGQLREADLDTLKSQRVVAEIHERYPDQGDAPVSTSRLYMAGMVGDSDMDHLWARWCGFPDPIPSPNAFSAPASE
ncbi:hypothetical protein [Caulobacter endophyticus]|uniref:hypothetical protein n=1 Tax=Caulobacter endophyticus TaxID=2172652 RepID=UPI002410561D|nr:hypothetical protein [Caulobacter endophyticus]MDG2531026.1 hypothetical protein [Caulobacter endophyticus]